MRQAVHDPSGAVAPLLRSRSLIGLACLVVCFAAIAAQLLRLGLAGSPGRRMTAGESALHGWARPDIVDRNGRLMATDLPTHSLYADPQRVQDVDEAIEQITAELPSLKAGELRKLLGDRSRRFVWVARGLSPRHA
jgi:cell division protein FtsI (penicillin-binding protein 3)